MILGSDRACLVTGATSGIGFETARGMAHLGAIVMMVGRNPART
jgi:NAD(P)-dependent dehydrogenase (short-subunit alcohol dehydrogenase family)